MTEYEKPALDAIQRVYDNPSLEQLADRLEESLSILDGDPGDKRVRQRRMQTPKLWKVVIYGSGEVFTFLWDDEDGVVWVRWAGMQDI